MLDTGSLRGDFKALLALLARLEDHALMQSVFTGLATAASRDPELAAERDYRLILDIIPAFVFTQAVLGPETVSKEFLSRVITEIIHPLVALLVSSQWSREFDRPASP